MDGYSGTAAPAPGASDAPILRTLLIAACPLPWPRGTPIRIHRMAEALTRRGHDVHVVTYPLGNAAIPIPYRIHRVGRSSTVMDSRPGPSFQKFVSLDPSLCYRAARLLRELSFDVVHAHHYEGLIAALVARRATRPIPIVYDAHTLLASELPHYRLPLPRRLRGRLGLAFDRFLPVRADHIISVTDRMQEWFAAGAHIPPDCLSMIPNGVEHEHFAGSGPVMEQPATSSARNDGPVVMFAGNLAEYQGIELLLHSFARFRAASPGARLILVTDSPLDSFAARIDRLGLAECTSRVETDYAGLPGVLARADVLANPRTDCDGIPQKLLNYMAAGRPIVSFAGSAPVLEHEKSALLVPDGDTAAFGDALRRLHCDPKLGSRLADSARRKVVAEHGWEQVAEKVESVYRQLVPNSR